MAMIHCPECNSEVSETASKCPSCGFLINKPTRSIFGKIIKWTFIIFNVIMAFWFFGGMSDAIDKTQALEGAEQAGAAIGTGIGGFIIVTIWAVGDIILGLFVLFTKPKAA